MKNFPICRDMIVYLKSWLVSCDLTGSRAINTYTLVWFVIFFLQMKQLVPSVAKLIEGSGQSRVIAEWWETGVTYNFLCAQSSVIDIKLILLEFFKFYGNIFDFQHYVACPLAGYPIAKGDFAKMNKLPPAMDPYKRYLISGRNTEFFR